MSSSSSILVCPQSHPKVDKALLSAHTVSPVSGAFPAGGDLTLLRWRGEGALVDPPVTGVDRAWMSE